jgi:pimeloyl-ACP methyl ester carboxylesterase
MNLRSKAILVCTAVLVAAGCMASLEPLERPLVFRPRALQEESARILSAAPNRVEEVRVRMEDGVTLHGWLRRPERSVPGERYPLVIVYGGVNQEVSEFVSRAHTGSRWGMLMINYRGFGLSEGSPSERAVLSDAKRVYDWAAERPDVDTRSIVVLGRSLGSYVAIAVAAARHVRGAILATPWDSAAALGQDHFYGLPLGWLMQNRYNPALIAPAVSAPALFVLAEKDDVTPVKNGLALARRWGGFAKTVLLAGAGHQGLEEREEFWRAVADFLGGLDQMAALSSAAPTVSAQVPSRGR